MAIHADTIWECRQGASANNVNGGGFNASNASPGTDRSQQDAAFDSGTDLVSADGDAVPAIITSASHNFDSDDHGNIIHIISGAGWTVGWYEIVSTAANAATLDRAVGADGALADGVWYLGGAMSLNSTLDDEFFEQFTAGNTCYFKEEGSPFTLGENLEVAKDGSVTAAMKLIGYKAARGTIPTGTDRPLIAAAANTLNFDNSWHFRHLRITTTAPNGIRADGNVVYINCYSNNSSGSSSRNALRMDGSGPGLAYSCEAECVNGYGIRGDEVAKAFKCYIHDSTIGFTSSGAHNMVVDNIFDTCTTGIAINDDHYGVISGNTIYGGVTGLYSSVASNITLVINNIFDGLAIGANWATQARDNFADYNCYNATTSATINLPTGSSAVIGDPTLTDPTGSPPDFTLQTGSPALDTGVDAGTDTGATA